MGYEITILTHIVVGEKGIPNASFGRLGEKNFYLFFFFKCVAEVQAESPKISLGRGGEKGESAVLGVIFSSKPPPHISG